MIEVRQTYLADGRWVSELVVDDEVLDSATGMSRIGTLEALTATAEGALDLAKGVFVLVRASFLEEMGRAEAALAAGERPTPTTIPWTTKGGN